MKEQKLLSVGHGYALVRLKSCYILIGLLCVEGCYHALVRLLCIGELLYVMDCSYALKVVVMHWRQLCVDYYCRRGGSIR